ncbi:uncharacterized protein LOC117314798 [Pecten maximus]|uniref:uncharacterized protein LOC117314798 n=1 Tax=Pecten maximus TaxID=6579 RepID=UPI0014584184|nr:uncharacterized protein LOC117314798 [Pecten maximus]
MNIISCECVLLFSNYTGFENVRMDAEADHVTYVKQCLLISKEQVPRVPYVDVCHQSSNICSTLNPSVTTSIDTTSAVVTTTGSSDPGTTATNTTATCAPTNETANSMPISHLDRSSCAINISWELPANANISLIMQNVALLKQELETMKNNTSRYKRRKVSWPDDRVVSKSLGGLGVSILVFLFLLIVLSDVRAFKASKAVMSDMT